MRQLLQAKVIKGTAPLGLMLCPEPQPRDAMGRGGRQFVVASKLVIARNINSLLKDAVPPGRNLCRR
jgi:hypothetical protein